MPMAPYVLVLAKNTHEGAKYARRAKLTRGRYRVVSQASSIRGLRRAHVHILPGFHKRIDRHAIMAVLRHAQCEVFDVTMPERVDGAVGEQMTIDEALAARRADIVEVMAAERQRLADETGVPVAVLETFEEEGRRRGAAMREEREAAELARVATPVVDLVAPRVASEDEEPKVIPALVDLAKRVADEDEEDDEPVAPVVKKNRRRSMCSDCETLHFRDEACPVVAAKTPAVFE